ncbi:MAG: DUF1272 domain-containing protein [Marinicellaceae bacterium]
MRLILGIYPTNHYTGKMLELRPNCELCDKDLPVDATDACICTYECTFCRNCVENVLKNVCPNCGGGFVSRPIRPKVAHRNGVSNQFQLPSDKRILTKYSKRDIEIFIENIKDIPVEKR